MKSLKYILVSAIVAAIAAAISISIEGTGRIALALLESAIFGIGVAFVVFGYPLWRRVPKRKPLLPTYLAISWLLLSWWPRGLFRAHDLVMLDLAFYSISIIAAFVNAHHLYDVMHKEAGDKDEDLRKGGYEIWK